MILFSCKDTSALVSKALDHKLTVLERLLVRLHLLVCPMCARFRRSLLFLRTALRRFEAGSEGVSVEDNESPRLSPQARERLKQAVEQSLHGQA